MDADFPAAHSMDTEWFAVDQDGQVALFVSGADGSVPDGAPAADLGEVLRTLGGSETAIELFPELARLGLHVYEVASYFFSGPYRRTHRPPGPLHVDQLPPRLRQQAKIVRFDGLRFEEKELLQPCDYTACSANEVAYLAEDGKTIRPVPGREKEYRRAIAYLRQRHPEQCRKYCFEGTRSLSAILMNWWGRVKGLRSSGGRA
jgi:hypothetical protein